MPYLFGRSAHWQQQKIQHPLDAYLALAGFYLLLLIPFLMVAQRWLADVACGLLGVLLLAHSIKRKNWRWLKEPPVLIALCLWAYSALIVTPLALDVGESLTRVGWIRFVLMFAAMVYWLADYRDELRKVAFYVLLFLLFVVLDSFVQYITGMSLTQHPIEQTRLTGPFNKVIVGIYLAKMSLPFIGILLYEAWRARNIKQMGFYISALTAIFSLILLSNERTASITFIAGLGVIGLVLFIYIKQLRKWIILLALLQIGIVAGVFASQKNMQARMQESTAMMQNFDNSPYMQLWESSYLMWKEYPFFGVGLKNFRIACPPLLESGVVHYCDNHSHNVYLEFLSEMGAFGLIGLILMIGSFIFVILKQQKNQHRDGAMLTAFALATLAVNFFPLAANQSFFANWPAMLAWQSIAWALAITRTGETRA